MNGTLSRGKHTHTGTETRSEGRGHSDLCSGSCSVRLDEQDDGSEEGGKEQISVCLWYELGVLPSSLGNKGAAAEYRMTMYRCFSWFPWNCVEYGPVTGPCKPH